LRLEGRSIEELQARVLAEHGPAARIVAAERITVGGVGGFFARRHFEVNVEIGAPAPQGSRVVIDAPARAGIAALLEDAEEREAALQLRGSATGAAAGVGAGAGAGVGSGAVAAAALGIDDSGPSTRTPAFAELLDDLSYNAPSPADPVRGVPAGARAASGTTTLLAVPAPLSSAGDLVFVIGPAADALAVATAIAAAAG